MRSWFPTCSYRVEVPSISEQPNQMNLLFGSLGSREGSAPHKYPWERRREKGPLSYQSEHACSSPSPSSAERGSSFAQRSLTRSCTRRFFARHASVVSVHTGRSAPNDAIVMRAASTPFDTRYFMTNLARFSPMLRFCSLVPLPSVYPSIRRSRVGFSLSQPTAPSRTRVSAHRASDRPGPKWTSLRVSCVLNPLVGASGNLRALEAGGVGADAEPSGAGAGDAGGDHAGVEAEGVAGQPAHPATATTNSMSPSTTTVDLRCKRRRSHQPTVMISWIGSCSERQPEGIPVRISENGSTRGASRGN